MRSDPQEGPEGAAGGRARQDGVPRTPPQACRTGSCWGHSAGEVVKCPQSHPGLPRAPSERVLAPAVGEGRPEVSRPMQLGQGWACSVMAVVRQGTRPLGEPGSGSVKASHCCQTRSRWRCPSRCLGTLLASPLASLIRVLVLAALLPGWLPANARRSAWAPGCWLSGWLSSGCCELLGKKPLAGRVLFPSLPLPLFLSTQYMQTDIHAQC